MYIARRVGQGDNLATQLIDFFDRIGCYVPRSGHCAILTFEPVLFHRQHVFHHIDRAITGGFCSDKTAAEFQPFARQYTDELIGQPLVLPEHVADFPGANTDVPGRHIHIWSDMVEKGSHERLTETVDFGIRFSLGIKIRTAFAAAHGQPGQGILECLLEGKKLKNTLRNAGVKTYSAFIWSDGIIILYPVSAVDANITVVIFPANPKRHNPIRLGHAF